MARPYYDLIEVVENLRKALRPATASREFMEALVALTEVSKQMRPQDANRVFATLIPEISEAARSSPDLRFAMEALQKVFDTEVRGKMKFANELEWFMKSQSKLVEELRLLLAGMNVDQIRYFLQVTGDRVIGYNNAVRNDYLPKIVDAFVEVIQQSPDRLAALTKFFSDNGVIKEFQLSGLITDIDLWKIKGEIMEMLTLPMKLSHLKEVQKQFPNAVLIEKVMAKTKLTKAGDVSASDTFLQIWDGIIAEVTNQGLRIITKFEVKSGMHGFQQGFEQIMRTQYTRFSSAGDEIRVVLKNGAQRIFKFSNKPNTPNSIIGIKSENILISPKGESAFLPNQAVKSGDFDFKTLLLELDGREIDHFDIETLVMDLLMSLKP
jgi:hypothetical protein